MARPRKIGLDYFPFDVDFFEDDKIIAISVQYGIKGEIAAVKLLCAIYRNGYFIEWKESVCIKLLRELPGISEPLLENIVRGLVKWGFFDKELFESCGVLTSRGIQSRYFSISRRNRRSWQGGELPYLLVDDGINEKDKEKKDILKEGVLEFSDTKTEFSATETELSHTKSTQIKEKERKIKEKEIKEKTAAVAATPSQNVEKRKTDFYESLIPYVEKYGPEMVREFFDYWSELNRSHTKMRFEQQPTWEVGKRLATWARNDDKFMSRSEKSSTSSVNELWK